MGSWGTIYNNTRIALARHSRMMAEIQEQIASGARVNRASDDPPDALRIMRLRAQAESLADHAKNLDDVSRTLEFAHDILSDVSNCLQIAQQKLEQGASGTCQQATRVVLGEEINSQLDQIVFQINTSNLGRFVFSGAKTDTQPYTVEQDGQYITSVEYQGSQDALMVPVAPGVDVAAATVGDEVFRSDSRETPQFFGNTGAKPGAGTPNVRGDILLDITHKETTIVADPGGSGLAVSADPDDTDTILGRHDLIVDVPNMTIRFTDGPAVAFDGTETSLEVMNDAGDVVYVDVTGLDWTLLNPVTVTVQADGYLCIDDAVPPVELTDFTDDNVAVFDANGRVLYVDATEIKRTGLEAVRVPGTYDVFGALMHARDLLLNRHELSGTRQREMAERAIDSLKEVHAGVAKALATLGARLEALEALDQTLSNIQATASDQAGELENADIVELASDLAQSQTLYQMTLAAAAKLLTMSLLDYI